MRISDIMGADKPKRIFKCFSVTNSSPISVESTPTKVNFSERPDLAKEEYEIINFSLLERIRLNKLSPRQILRRRVNEVVRYLRGNNLDNISANRDVLLQYLNEYIYSIIVKLMNDPKVKQINLILVLGLPALLKDLKSVRNLQRFLLRTKREINSKGYIPRILQNKLSKYYSEFWDEFLKSLESRYLTGEKVGSLSGRKESDVTKLPITMAFSKSEDQDKFIKEVEEIIYKMMDEDEPDYNELFGYLDKNKLPVDKKKFILEDEDLSAVIYKYLNNHNKKSVTDYLDGATLKTVKVNFNSITTNFAEVPVDNSASVVDPNAVQAAVPGTQVPVQPQVAPPVQAVQPQVQPQVAAPQVPATPAVDPNQAVMPMVDPNAPVQAGIPPSDPSMMNGSEVIDPMTQQLMAQGQVPDQGLEDNEKVVENDNYKVGVIRGPRYSTAYVAFSNKFGYKVHLYKLNKSTKINFTELVKLPCKSVNVKSMSEISKYL